MRSQTVCISLTLAFVVPWNLLSSAYAQVPNAIKERLMQGGVVLYGGQQYATVTGTLRGTREAMESMLGTKAMRAISYKLCALEPVSGRRLETKIEGLSMIASELIGTELSVTMSAPEQKLSCQVIALAPYPSAPPSLVSPPSNTAVPAKPCSGDISIRDFGYEY